jgi:hypothetical protein
VLGVPDDTAKDTVLEVAHYFRLAANTDYHRVKALDKPPAVHLSSVYSVSLSHLYGELFLFNVCCLTFLEASLV